MRNGSKTNRVRLRLEQLEDRCVPAVLHVGTQAGELTFAQAASSAQNGDTVQVDPGTYRNFDVKWRANNLTIQTTGGVTLDDTGYSISNQKGIFDVIGNSVTVQGGFTFKGAHDPTGGNGKNYAGIRDEGDGMTLDHCTFLNNDDGILVTPASGHNGLGDVLVRYSVFQNNGYGDGQSHNMYIGHVHSFTLEYSETQDAYVGHDVKSRAWNTYLLYNFIGDSGSGANDQSSLVDLPDGGTSILIGNVLHKGSSSNNGTMIDSNLEGWNDSTQENPTQSNYLVNNTVVNDRSAGTYFLVDGSTTYTNLTNNIFAGLGEGGTTVYSGQNGAPAAPGTNSNNLAAVNPGFVNASGLDYHLTSGSAAINAGNNSPGSVSGFGSLTPTNQYVAVANTQARPVVGTLDIGAYEYGSHVAPTVLDAGFEQPSVGSGSSAYQYNPTGTAWQFSSQSGVSGNNSGFTSGNPAAPEGSQVGFLQGTGSISQSMTINADSYTVNFQAAQRGNYQASSQTIQVLLDGVVVGTITPSGTAYAAYSVPITVSTTGTHTLTFRGLNPNGGDNTAFIDAVAIV